MAQIEATAEQKERAAVALGGGLELRADGVVRKCGLTAAAKAADVSERLDLPKDDPLYGQRLVKVVPSGMPDCTLDEKGRLVPVVVRDGRVVIGSEDVERVVTDVTR
jgi:hypothetical protein